MYSFLNIDNLSVDFKTRNGIVHGVKNVSMDIKKVKFLVLLVKVVQVNLLLLLQY